MSTTQITADADTDRVTLINIFTVAPERQEALCAALAASTETTFLAVPGFISANIHQSIDGRRVANYAQWASATAYQEAADRPEIQAHFHEIAALAEGFDPTLFRVVSTHSAH